MTGVDGELMRFRADLLVVRTRHADAPDTRRVAAFAEEVERVLAQLELVGEAFDALVDLTEDGLVQPDACFSYAHSRALIPA